MKRLRTSNTAACYDGTSFISTDIGVNSYTENESYRFFTRNKQVIQKLS